MTTDGEYWRRVIDSRIEGRLRQSGAISIEGPKGCGKTFTAKQFCNSMVQFSDPRNPGPTLLAQQSPGAVLEGDPPRLLDEWQAVPQIWDSVRFEVDERKKLGQFILTGSSVPPRKDRFHSGAGRISSIQMFPMSLYESTESDGSISVRGLFEHDAKVSGKSDMELEDIAICCARGGWPMAVITGVGDASFASDYNRSVIDGDISLADGKKRDRRLVGKLVRALARNISTMTATTTIHDDVKANTVEGIERGYSRKTIDDYLSALDSIFYTVDVPACGETVRSTTPLRESSKRQLCDPSLAVAALGMDAKGLMADRRTFGFVFESLCTRDLRVYMSPLDGEVTHYHDRSDLEVDLILEMPDGRWGAVEVKLSEAGVESGAENLLALRDKLRKAGEKEAGRTGSADGKRGRPPEFMMVLTATGYAYVREDGVMVVPIGLLGP